MKTNDILKFTCLFFLFPVFLFTSCGNNKESPRPSGLRSSIGKTLELLVVADPEIYKNGLKKSVDSLFEQPQLGLNQAEPLFDVYNIPASAFLESDLFRIRRNLLMIKVNPDLKSNFLIMKNKWAYPQLIIDVSAPNSNELKKLLIQHFEEIKQNLYVNERINLANIFKSNENKKLTAEQQKNFGFSLTIPKEYYKASLDKEFAWFRKETPEFSIGILIYSIDYDSSTLPSHKEIINIRNQMTKKYIPGSIKGSYMHVEPQEEPMFRNITIQNMTALEIRGLWSVEGDHMGGPFVDYVFVDSKSKKLIMLDGFVYHPSMAKRDLLMQAESILSTFKFKTN